MNKYLFLLLFMSFVTLASPRSPVNIQSTGTATTARGLQYGQIYIVQCDAAAYMLWGDSTVAVSKVRGNASFGVPLAANYVAVTRAGNGDSNRFVSIISESGTANCTFWVEDP